MAEKLKIIPLGGLNEIGKNMTVYEHGGEIIVVDCGMGFPDDDMYGIDVVIPDVTYLIKNQNKIRGIFITHGHEDHIGALPYVLRSVNAPIYATRMSAGLIKLKLEEHRLLSKTKLITCEAGDLVKAGRFSVEFIHVNHSIADAVAFAIKCPAGVCVHTGDFKIDATPIQGGMMDLARLGELGKEGVLALLASAKELAFDRRVCLVFLDNNERNLLGASAFKKAHPDRAAENLFIDLDCVGDGDCLLLLPSKYSRWDGDLLAALEAAFPAGEEMTPVLRAKGLHYYPSDNRRFKFHVAVCACRFLAGLGYYIPRLHTKRDTVLSEENAAYVARSVARFVPLYLDGGDPS